MGEDDAVRWAGRLFLAPGVFLYLRIGAAADSHAQHAVQFAWAKKGRVTLRLGDHAEAAAAFLVPAGVEHAFDAAGLSIALLLVERHGVRGQALDRCARQTHGEEMVPRLAGMAFPSMDLTPEMAVAWCDSILDALGAGRGGDLPSRTSRRVVTYVEGALDGTPRISEAARVASVSASRLTHVFSKEVGIPFRRFVLWARIKRAVEATRRGASVTEAAMEAGFSDSAYLSRTFRSMFGLPPSMRLSRLEIVGSLWSASR